MDNINIGAAKAKSKKWERRGYSAFVAKLIGTKGKTVNTATAIAAMRKEWPDRDEKFCRSFLLAQVRARAAAKLPLGNIVRNHETDRGPAYQPRDPAKKRTRNTKPKVKTAAKAPAKPKAKSPAKPKAKPAAKKAEAKSVKDLLG